MSLDELVRADSGELPVLSLPHQCEFLSDQWLAWTREFLSQKFAKSPAIAPFTLFERFVGAPPHLRFANDIAQWSMVWDGQQVLISRDDVANPDLRVTGAYQAALASAQVVGAASVDVMTRARREIAHWFGDDALCFTGQLADAQAYQILVLLHDHMARRTVENPDVGHRIRALGLEKNLAEVSARGYTVIERAISPEFADEVRSATLNALLPHESEQLQWMLYHGREFEALVQNAPLMTLMDATLGRGAVIASISAIRKGPGPGAIPMHNDYSLVPEPYPEFAMTGVGVWALEDWQESSGPTWFVPGSHLERRAPRPGEGLDRGVPVTMPKGSVVYFTHGVWHWQGDRADAGERVTIHSHFNRGILRGLEPKKIDAQMLHRNPPRLGEMLGEDDWFDKLDATGRDYLRAGHMVRLQAFNNERLRALTRPSTAEKTA